MEVTHHILRTSTEERVIISKIKKPEDLVAINRMDHIKVCYVGMKFITVTLHNNWKPFDKSET